ncbi:MAG: hypothetical protein OEO77_03680, partial [Acidimicrobiia bacterium]|nr:hypothetical protein [Acidimicrobiia bacterium]
SAEPDRLGALVVHELVHMEQWRRMGVVRFLGRYVGEYFRERLRGVGPRAAYLAIGLEREARERTMSILETGGGDQPGIS